MLRLFIAPHGNKAHARTGTRPKPMGFIFLSGSKGGRIMKRTLLALFAGACMMAGSVGAASALYIGPSGVYLGPGPHHHYYDYGGALPDRDHAPYQPMGQ